MTFAFLKLRDDTIFSNINMDIATDMDALKNISNLNILRKRSVESLLTSLLIKRERLIELRDEHMIFSVHVQIEALDKDIRDVQSIINGKCGF